MSLYQSIEQTFFNTLTKKIVGNVVFLLLPHIILLGLGFYYFGGIEELSHSRQSAQQVLAEMTQRLDAFKNAGLATVIFALVSGVATIFFMRYLFLKPIRGITHVLSAISEKDGDISATLPDYTHDEISEMARSYNLFSKSLKGMIADTRERSVRVALCSTQLQKVLKEANVSAGAQVAQAQMVFQSSTEATQAIDEIAANTLAISEKNSSNLQEVRSSCDEMSRVLEQVRAISHQVSSFQDTIVKLSKNSANITEILGMVQDFSDQTNLLALNASIEAARAGDAGRGFSVVADEVRNLSQKVSSATSEIDLNIEEMVSLVNHTRSGADTIMDYVGNTESFIDQTNQQFQHMVSDFEGLNSQLASISAAIDELAYTNRESHSHVSKITEVSGEIRHEMEQSQEFSEQLELATEETQELLSRFIIGSGSFEDMIQTGRGWAKETQTCIERLSKQGKNIFDTNYVRTNPNQLPEKFNTSYVESYEAVMRPLFDSFISKRPEFIYAIAIDKNGYAPAHHSKVSERITGNYDVDNLKSRHRRIFAGNRAEKRRATHTAPFLLQTFIRDTGEVLNDLSIPLYVNGQHWGALIMGFNPENLLDKK